MLILSRRAEESIVIGDEVVITILSVKGKQVRVGITAPPDVSVHREEIYQRIQSGELDVEPGSVAVSTFADADRQAGAEAEQAGSTEAGGSATLPGGRGTRRRNTDGDALHGQLRHGEARRGGNDAKSTSPASFSGKPMRGNPDSVNGNVAPADYSIDDNAGNR